MRKTLTILLLTTLTSTSNGQTFVLDSHVTANAMPESIWPHQPPLRTPPLASPDETSNGLLTTFWLPNLSQNNPNSPPPKISPQCAKWVWSGSDNDGWKCTAKPAQTTIQTTPPTPATATCTLIETTFTCTADRQTGGVTTADGQPACLLAGTNTAILDSTGQPILCTNYN